MRDGTDTAAAEMFTSAQTLTQPAENEPSEHSPQCGGLTDEQR